MARYAKGVSYWNEIVGQPEAVRVLEQAASYGSESDLSHAWLITGPPGSGRSNLALRFAAALIARDEQDRARVFEMVRSRSHPDAAVLTTQKVIIGIDDVRDIVAAAHFAPSEGRHRVIVIEDADRMPERTSNVLLKSLEEPPERTIWVLCAPSEADLLPTIRSRARSLRLVTPPPSEVARLLHERDNISPELAERAARLAQSHIGMARRLAASPEALQRRERTVEIALTVETLSDGMRAAAELLKVAQADAEALTTELDAREREDAMRNMGLAPGATVPPQLRSQLRALEEDQKRRSTRSLRDGIDRILVDLLTVHRDVLLATFEADLELVNLEQEERIVDLARRNGAGRALAALAAIEQARERLGRSVTPGLVLEAMFASMVAHSREPLRRTA